VKVPEGTGGGGILLTDLAQPAAKTTRKGSKKSKLFFIFIDT
jgi:hypothetical protein